jgi:hypothetical protein
MVEINETELRKMSLEYTIRHYENKTEVVPHKTFMQTLEQIYLFLKNGQTKERQEVRER